MLGGAVIECGEREVMGCGCCWHLVLCWGFGECLHLQGGGHLAFSMAWAPVSSAVDLEGGIAP